MLEVDTLVLRVASVDADPLIAAFTGGRRLVNPTLRYLALDGSTALEITAEYGEFVSAVPDFTGDGVAVELAFDPRVYVSAP